MEFNIDENSTSIENAIENSTATESIKLVDFDTTESPDKPDRYFKMVYIYLNNKEYIKKRPTLINGFSVVNGLYMGSDTLLSGGIAFRPKTGEYGMYYMKVVEETESGKSQTIIDIILDFEVLFEKAEQNYKYFHYDNITGSSTESSLDDNDKKTAGVDAGVSVCDAENPSPDGLNRKLAINRSSSPEKLYMIDYYKHVDEGDYYPIIITEKNYKIYIKLRILHRMEGEYQISGISYKKHTERSPDSV